MSVSNTETRPASRSHYTALKRNFLLIIFAVSITPLVLVGGILDRFNTASYHRKANDHLTELLEKHAQNIDRFLFERLSDIRFISRTFSLDQLNDVNFLKERLQALQLVYGPSFVDLGLVDESGTQVAYAGPFALSQARYSDARWFQEAIRLEHYVSDVFTGLRGQPHFIVAVRKQAGAKKWVLRATVDFVAFSTLVENIKIGKTGFAFILNRAGSYQIRPMKKIGDEEINYLRNLFQEQPPENGPVRIDITSDASNEHHIHASTFLKNQDWLLIYQQKTQDAFSSLLKVRGIAILIILASGIAIVVIAMILIRRMVNHLERAEQEKELMNRQVIETGKLASVGQLAAGIAHEINNPVAIMVEEAGWMQDLLADGSFASGEHLDEFERALAQIKTQGGRCKEITHKLLSFARKTDSRVQLLHINDVITEVVSLSTQRAKYSNVAIQCRLGEDLPGFEGSETEMQQVFMNLINNALDAMEKSGGTLALKTSALNGHLRIEISDTGPGVPEANLGRIFDPFFTTKAVGKGTGLGLSICYGIIERMTGEITVASRIGAGTRFQIDLPINVSAADAATYDIEGNKENEVKGGAI